MPAMGVAADRQLSASGHCKPDSLLPAQSRPNLKLNEQSFLEAGAQG